MGKAAREWLNLLANNGISVWQLLPLAPTDSMGSPYSSPSSFAINPWFLDIEDLIEEGFFDDAVKQGLPKGNKYLGSVDFSLADLRSEYLGKALRENWATQNQSKHIEFENWRRNQFWLQDHCLFMELKRQNNGNPWWKWPKQFASHRSLPLKKWAHENSNSLLEHALLQWHLYRQLKALRALAKKLGILMFGDMPFYVSKNSADVWSNRRLFSIDSNGDMSYQSGVPPDYFSETGQLWGTPIYKWPRHQFSRYRWWRKRFLSQKEQVDLVRLDHFRALFSFWCIDGDKNLATEGRWEPSPGFSLLSHLKKDFGGTLPLVAEDLGVVTNEVEKLRDEFNLPGMKILQFAFDGNLDNPYLPENIKGNNWVVYTGTHDNPTTMEWWEGLSDEERNRVSSRFKGVVHSPAWELIELGLSTNAKLVIVPIQDLLCLGADARFNKPGTTNGNWNWRLHSFDQSLKNSLEGYGVRGRFWGRSFKDGLEFLNNS